MYSPFEFNDLLGPFMILGLLKGAFVLTILLFFYSAYLEEQEHEID